jgi:hypothetical protein
VRCPLDRTPLERKRCPHCGAVVTVGAGGLADAARRGGRVVWLRRSNHGLSTEAACGRPDRAVSIGGLPVEDWLPARGGLALLRGDS